MVSPNGTPKRDLIPGGSLPYLCAIGDECGARCLQSVVRHSSWQSSTPFIPIRIHNGSETLTDSGFVI